MFTVNTALLDAFVLSVLSRGDAYGYALTQEVRKMIDISESTLYPVLRRLQKNGFLDTYDEPYMGRNRRYYTLTDEGKAQNMSYRQEWKIYKEKVDAVLLEEE
ncbi:MAG: PadR family transcriptional regulator [Oscillospiraceae bacterium]